MRSHKELYLVILGTFFFFTLVLSERRELEGYKFPVYSTPFCPRNESEWNKRSSVLNCSETKGYTCLPNQQLTELLEFCYTQPRILIEGGICLYLVKSVSKVNGYNCQYFRNGCPKAPFLSDRIFEYPGCLSLGNGCFLEEPSCNSGRFPYLPENGSMNIKEDVTISNIYSQQSIEEINTSTNDREEHSLTAILIATILGTIFSFCVPFLLLSFFAFHQRRGDQPPRHLSAIVETASNVVGQHNACLSGLAGGIDSSMLQIQGDSEQIGQGKHVTEGPPDIEPHIISTGTTQDTAATLTSPRPARTAASQQTPATQAEYSSSISLKRRSEELTVTKLELEVDYLRLKIRKLNGEE